VAVFQWVVVVTTVGQFIGFANNFGTMVVIAYNKDPKSCSVWAVFEVLLGDFLAIFWQVP
jgi:hypothetical protein